MLTSDEEIIREMARARGDRNILLSPETRRLEKRRLIWPEINETIGNKLVVRQLDLTNFEEIEQTAGIYRIGFPELFGGVYEDLLFPRRYHNLTRQMKMLVLTENKKVVSAWALTPCEKNMSVEFSLTVTDPDKRGKGLCKEFTKVVDKIVEEAGTEYGLVYCATFHKTTQRIFRELGFKKEAELKGFILAYTGEGNYARDNVVMYSKFYNGADRLCPLEMKLI